MNKQPIGILDSGVGGLSVYRELALQLPHEEYVYLGDNAYAPYGKLSEEVITQRAKQLVSFLQKQKVKLIVVACNTMTVVCIDELRAAFPKIPIIGTVPVVKLAAATTKNGKIGILSTTRTAASEYQKELIKTFAADKQVTNRGTNELVPLIEKGEVMNQAMQTVLQDVLADFEEAEVDTLVLGSTHYPFIKPLIQKMMGDRVVLLDSGAAIARHAHRILVANKIAEEKKNSKSTFYTTGDTVQFNAFAKQALGVTIASEKISV